MGLFQHLNHPFVSNKTRYISSSPTTAIQCLFYRCLGRFHHFGRDLLLYVGSGFSQVIYSILNFSVILERSKSLLARNKTSLLRNKLRGGNLYLSGTVWDFESPSASTKNVWCVTEGLEAFSSGKILYKEWEDLLAKWSGVLVLWSLMWQISQNIYGVQCTTTYSPNLCHWC